VASPREDAALLMSIIAGMKKMTIMKSKKNEIYLIKSRSKGKPSPSSPSLLLSPNISYISLSSGTYL